MLTVEVELIGELLFIFGGSSGGVEAARAVPTLVAGRGSRLMTGMAAVEAGGNGAVRRLLRRVVVVELEEERWERAASGGDFSGSGAEIFNNNHTWVTTENRPQHHRKESHSGSDFNENSLLGLTRCLQYLLDLVDSSFLLFIKVLHSDGIAQFWRWGLHKKTKNKTPPQNNREMLH